MIRPAQSLLLKSIKARQSYKIRNQINAYLFLLPALIIFAVFSWNPIITTIVYSFQKVGLGGPSSWVGVQNYVRMFGNPVFLTAWKNVAEFVGLSIIFGFMVPIILALIINELRRFGSVFQVITYIPTLVPIAIALLIWRLIYAPEGGALNSVLKALHLPTQLWLQDPHTVKLALILIMTWLGAGGSILIYLAAMKEINPEVYEAAELDGVSPLNRVIFITLPLLKSRMAIMMVLQIIAVAQVFTEPFILTTGGPGNNTLTPVLEIYRTAFERSDFGLASTWSVSLLVVLGTFSVLYVWLTRRGDENRLS
jgi:multiple sugar transport system permease protein